MTVDIEEINPPLVPLKRLTFLDKRKGGPAHKKKVEVPTSDPDGEEHMVSALSSAH